VLNAAEVAENWRLSTRSVDIFVRSQIYHTFAVLQCVARNLSATADPCFSKWRPPLSWIIKISKF